MSIPLHIRDTAITLTPLQEIQIIEAVSPTIDVEQTEDGYVVTITDIHGEEEITLPAHQSATVAEVQEIIDEYPGG